MTGPPARVSPPEKEAAAQAGTGAAGKGTEQKQKQEQTTTNDADRLAKMALAVARGGELYEFLPERPEWYRRIGGELSRRLAAKRVMTRTDPSAVQLHPRGQELLEFVYRLALARRRGAEIGPAYRGPTYSSVDEARAALSAEFDNILAETLAYQQAVIRIAA